MTRERILMILGALVLISPWSGLPLSWLTWILPAIGLVVLTIGFTLRNRTTATPPALPEVREEPQSRSSNIAYS